MKRSSTASRAIATATVAFSLLLLGACSSGGESPGSNPSASTSGAVDTSSDEDPEQRQALLDDLRTEAEQQGLDQQSTDCIVNAVSDWTVGQMREAAGGSRSTAVEAKWQEALSSCGLAPVGDAASPSAT